MNRTSLRLLAGRAAVTSALLAGPAALAQEAELPGHLEGIVFGDEKREVTNARINGVEFNVLKCFSELPYLMWPTDEARPVELPADRRETGRWLARAAADLGFEGFEPRFIEQTIWHANEVWVYELVRDGRPLHDTRLEVHRLGKRFLGIVNHTLGPVAAIRDPDGAADAYYPLPAQNGGYEAVPVTVTRERLPDRTISQVIAADGAVLEVENAPDLAPWQREGEPEFSEYIVPNGSFPDQISVDSDGIVWLSDPAVNKMIEFDPDSESFTLHNTTGSSGPDGLIVGSGTRVWSGMYYTGELGLLDSSTDTYTRYAAPYSSAAMAIPVETSDGMVWVTDHARNRISEFDPSTNIWLQSIVMPIANCWVVQGHEDQSRRHVYFTEYNANRLGRISLGGSTVTDLAVPGGGPAFCVYSDGYVYYSRWTESGIGRLDVETGAVTEFEFPVGNEPGGPLWLRPGGDIVTGTRNRGYIMVFHVDTETFSALQIPTSFPGLKDGLTVGADDTIWFTETGANKLGKLVFCPDTCDADFNGDGLVNTQDVLSYLNAWVAGDAEADINEDGVVNTLDFLAFLNLWNAGC